MANIQPFHALHPPSQLVAKVAVYIENKSLDDARKERDENSISYIHLLVPQKKDAKDGKKEAFKIILENLDDLKRKGILIRDDRASIYVIRISGAGGSYTGVWATTSVEDYATNSLKRHELIDAERESKLLEYLENTGLDGNPVLITYRDDQNINGIIEAVTVNQCFLTSEKDNVIHEIWRISDSRTVLELLSAFSGLKSSYIADGHHRAAAAVELAKLNSEQVGFTSVYVPASQIEIFSFHRLVSDLNGFSVQEFLMHVKQSFHIHQLTNFDSSFGQIILYLDQMWFVLFPKDHISAREGIVSNLPVSLAHDFIIKSILEIQTSADSKRMETSSNSNIDELKAKVDKGLYRLGLFLPPLTIEEVMAVADAGEVLPPKSTYVLPKFPSGLLIREIGGLE